VSLARRLTEAFAAAPPRGWVIEREAPLFPQGFARRLGYDPAADLVLRAPTGERVIVELEISRADPVANHAKVLLGYAEGHLRRDRDTFVSMLSPHVQRGRRNLAALFTRHMRTTGHGAFAVSLLPELSAAAVASLNHADDAPLPTPARELRRALAVAAPVAADRHRLHLAGDATDVLASLWRCHDELSDDRTLSWRRRPVANFVHDPASGLFAPAKFCAFVPARGPSGEDVPPTMTHAVYATLGERDPRFDGHVAWRHLVGRLAFDRRPLEGHAAAEAFGRWREALGARMPTRAPTWLLTPPAWW
jgi:hypothetical protein